jgi:hypothetical protein
MAATVILFCVIIAVFYLPINNPKNLFFTEKQVDKLEKRVDSLEKKITIIEQKDYGKNK